jgi:hypothetical protein
MLEISLSHGRRLRLSVTLHGGLHLFPGTGNVVFDSPDRVARYLLAFIGQSQFIFAILFLLLSLTKEQLASSPRLAAHCYKNPPNPDIVGLGVRYNLHVVILLVHILVCGFFPQAAIWN